MNEAQIAALREAATWRARMGTFEHYSHSTRETLEGEVEDAKKRLAGFMQEEKENAQRIADLLENLPTVDELLEGIEP